MGFDIRRLDIYRKVPKDLTQPTLTGAIISVLCCTAITVLVVSELNRFLSTEVLSDVYVDNPGKDDRIPVSVTVELPNLNCEFVGLDIQDNLGRHEVGFVDNTEKTPIGENDKGCIFHSTFFINKVPGNFHISTHSATKQPEDPDFSHVIREVRLGDKIIAKNIPASFDPLAGVAKNTELGGIESHDYIMKIVPTIYESRSGKSAISYQYTYAYRSFLGRGHPAIWFRYDLSPLTVKYREHGEPFFSFLTAICAVVGGVFTVANMVDGLIFSATELYKKLEIGKLS